ncbi:MAG TPA: DNA-binding response regulator, partial [Tistrella mobilis]|nr:DNA-binding response regulator [Tistrella mobilis]
LRQKIDKGFGRPLIRTHRGGGYSLGMEDPVPAGGDGEHDDR